MIIIVVALYVLTINAVTFFVYGIDKWKAQNAKWRIPEATLLWLAAAGGSVGALLGIEAWKHKTLHPQFRYGVPAILMGQAALLALVLYWQI